MPRPGTEASDAARYALDRGNAALSAGDQATAIDWLERAQRLAPRDPGITLARASACLGRDDARAEMLFQQIASRHDTREAWFGLAGARLQRGDRDGAAAALQQALQRHAPWSTLHALADGIARAVGAPGWCGVASDGTLTIQSVSGEPIGLSLDGHPVPGPGLPRRWRRCRQLAVQSGGRHLIGSPLDLAAIRRIEGVVEPHAGGLRGWAWHPGDPDADPVVVLTAKAKAGSRRRAVALHDDPAAVPGIGPLGRPRHFIVTADDLLGIEGLLHLQGPDGQDLLGSPLDPGIEMRSAGSVAVAIAAARGAGGGRSRTRLDAGAIPLPVDAPLPPAPIGRDGRRRRADVVVPVHDGAAETLACLDRVIATVPRPSRIVVVDDASTDPVLVAALDRLAATRRIVLLRHTRNLGFPAAANAGLAACPGRDVVLLNSDTLVPDGWLERLVQAARSAPDIGTVTPLSNAASILSYPDPAAVNPLPDLAETLRLDRLTRQANGAATVDIPVGVGFCLYLRRDCLDAVGTLRNELFAQGYGEENDYCLRARRLGWRNVALPGLFVAHAGGTSFGAAAAHLRRRNDTILERLHPGFHDLIAAFVADDPLAPARQRLDMARWQAGRRRGQRAAILITHDHGGGVEARCEASAAAHRAAGRRVIVLRPTTLPDGETGVLVGDGPEGGFANLRFRLPAEMPDLHRFLTAQRPELAELHHLLGFPPAMHSLLARLGCPYDVHIHDYAWFCPRIVLIGRGDRYCGEPAVAACETCVADLGSVSGEDIGVAALRDRSARLLAGARAVIAPSDDAAIRIRRHFPGLGVRVADHAGEDAEAALPAPERAAEARRRVVVVGAIGVHKGYNVLLECARDAAERDLDLEFVLVGHSIDDRRLLATGRIFVTGTYEPGEAVTLIRQQNATLAFIPSIWPETWCIALSEIWRAGLTAVAFDIGAPADRIRSAGRGSVLPLGLSPIAINNALVTAAGVLPVQAIC